MSRIKGWPLIPKGRAMALHLTPEYDEGLEVGRAGGKYNNKYDSLSQYDEWYAYDIGHQKGIKEFLDKG